MKIRDRFDPSDLKFIEVSIDRAISIVPVEGDPTDQPEYEIKINLSTINTNPIHIDILDTVTRSNNGDDRLVTLVKMIRQNIAEKLISGNHVDVIDWDNDPSAVFSEMDKLLPINLVGTQQFINNITVNSGLPFDFRGFIFAIFVDYLSRAYTAHGIPPIIYELLPDDSYRTYSFGENFIILPDPDMVHMHPIVYFTVDFRWLDFNDLSWRGLYGEQELNPTERDAMARTVGMVKYLVDDFVKYCSANSNHPNPRINVSYTGVEYMASKIINSQQLGDDPNSKQDHTIATNKLAMAFAEYLRRPENVVTRNGYWFDVSIDD